MHRKQDAYLASRTGHCSNTPMMYFVPTAEPCLKGMGITGIERTPESQQGGTFHMVKIDHNHFLFDHRSEIEIVTHLHFRNETFPKQIWDKFLRLAVALINRTIVTLG